MTARDRRRDTLYRQAKNRREMSRVHRPGPPLSRPPYNEHKCIISVVGIISQVLWSKRGLRVKLWASCRTAQRRSAAEIASGGR